MTSHLGKKLLFGIIALVIVPLGLVSFIVYSNAKQIIKEQIYTILNVSAASINGQLLSFLSESKARAKAVSSDSLILEALKKTNNGKAGASLKARLDKRLTEIKSQSPNILSVLVFDRNGRLFASTDTKGLNGSEASLLRSGLNKAAVGTIEINAEERYFPAFAPVAESPTGTAIGSVTVLFRASAIDSILSAEFKKIQGTKKINNDGQRGRILIVNRDKVIISSSDPALIGRRIDTEILKAALSGESPVTKEFIGIFGEKRIGVSMYLEEPGWAVIPSFQRGEVFAPLDKLALLTFPLISIGVITVIVFTFIISRRMTRSILEVTEAARHIAEGNLDERIKVYDRPPAITGEGKTEGAAMRRGPRDEIELLTDAFNQMAYSLEKSTHEREEFLTRLKESEEQYKTLFDYAEDSMLMLDLEGKVIAVNKREEEVLGYSAYDILGRKFSVILPEKFRDGFEDSFLKTLGGEKPPTAEVEVVSNAGGALAMEIDLTGIVKKERVSFVQAHLRNITGKKLLQKEVLLERNKLSTIVESMGDGLALVDKDFNIQFMNKKFHEVFGGTAIGHKCYEVYTSRRTPCDGCPLIRGVEEDSVPEITTRQGHTLLVLHSTIRNIDGTVSHLEIFKDITEKKRLESTLKELELYNTLFDYAEDSMLMADLEGVITAVNKREEEVVGHSGMSVSGTKFMDILSDKHRDAFKALFARVLEGERPPTAEVEVLKSDGGALSMEMDLTGIKKGDRIVFVVVHLRDVTRRKRLEQQLLRSERLNALSHFSSTLAHDLRNPIIGIRQRLKSLQTTMAVPAPEARVLTDIISSSELLLGMVNDVLDVYRNSYEELPLIISSFRFIEAVEDAINLLQIEAEEKRVEVALCRERESIFINGDKRRLERVFINLLDNAIKFSEAGSRVEIDFERIKEDNADYLLFKIEDSGVGIDPATLTSIFEPLYKVERKDTKTGTGLGLYFCKVVIAAHNGEIWAENREKGGAAFYFKVPLGGSG